MPKPAPPILLKDATLDKKGILVKWMTAGNSNATSHTVSWKAESWWQSVSVTIPATETELQITDLPAGEKVRVWMYSTNDDGAGPYSEEVPFVTTRDCCVKGELEYDFSRNVSVPHAQVLTMLFTMELQTFIMENDDGKVGKIESRQEGNSIVTKITPPVPTKLRQALEMIRGEFDMSYEEHADTSTRDQGNFAFEIKNYSIFGEYVETSKGIWYVLPDGDNCKIAANFDFRLKNVPGGYYFSQLIKASIAEGVDNLGANLEKYHASIQ